MLFLAKIIICTFTGWSIGVLHASKIELDTEKITKNIFTSPFNQIWHIKCTSKDTTQYRGDNYRRRIDS